MKKFILMLLILLLSAVTVNAQDSTAVATAADSVMTAMADHGPVAVPEPTEKALQYHSGNNWIWVFNLLWGMLIPAAFLFSGLSARIRDFAQNLGKKWFFVIAIYLIVYTLANYAIDFGISYYQGFVRQHAYELSNQSFGKWFGDSLKGLMVGTIMGVLTLWVPYLLLKKSPTRWWLYTGILVVPFLFLLILVQPLYIAPMFNEFGPMKDKALEGKILAMAERAGIEGSRVFEVNKSVDTKAVNAYVTGFMGSKRIVLWDTIIEKLDEDQLLFVMGHEMGHYVLGHLYKSIAFISVILMLALYGIYRTAYFLIDRYKDRFGFTELSDIASLPLILLLLNAYLFILTPVILWQSRSNEHESDRFGLEMTHDNHAAASAFVKLQQENLGVPRPGLVYKIWRASHPVLGERIDFCNSYKPWETGEEQKYKHMFKD